MNFRITGWVLFSFFFLFGFFSSCKKDVAPEPIVPQQLDEDEDSTPVQPPTIIDTLYPSNWLPAYTGSYWVYDQFDTVKIGNYKLDSLRKPVPFMMPYDYYTSVYVPVFDGISVFGDKFKHGYYELGYNFAFDYVGQSSSVSNQYNYYKAKCLVQDTVMVVNSVQYDSVQVVVYWYGNPPATTYPNTVNYQKNYFAKNTGIILQEFYQGDTLHHQRVLTDYYINW